MLNGTWCGGSDWWRSSAEGQPVPVTETKLKSRLRQLNLREGLCLSVFGLKTSLYIACETACLLRLGRQSSRSISGGTRRVQVKL